MKREGGTIGKSERPYRIPGEDDEPVFLPLTRGDVEIIQNALSLYCLWLKQKGTLPIEYGDVTPEQELILKRLSELDITPVQLAIELKSSTLQHAETVRDLVTKELSS